MTKLRKTLERCFFSFIGLLLLFSAIAKGYALIRRGLPDSQFLFLGENFLIHIECMLGLTLIFLSRQTRFFLTPVLFVTFGLFAFYQFYLSGVGSAHCGCFGDFSIPPIAMAIIDSVICALFFLALDESNS